MVRKGVAEKKIHLSKGLEEVNSGGWCADIWGRGFQAKEATSPKAPRQKHA